MKTVQRKKPIVEVGARHRSNGLRSQSQHSAIAEVPGVVKRHVLTSQIVQESMDVHKLNSLVERIALRHCGYATRGANDSKSTENSERDAKVPFISDARKQ